MMIVPLCPSLTLIRMSGTHHNNLPANLTRPLQAIILFPLAERMAVDIRCEIAHRGRDAFVEGGAEGQVAACVLCAKFSYGYVN